MNVKALVTLAIVLAMVYFSGFRVGSVRASGIIRIEADGSVNPSGAPVLTLDNRTYTLSDNVGSIFLGRDNIVLDGAGYSIQGRGIASGTGIYLNGRSNIEIRNSKIEELDVGISLNGSSNVVVTKNEIANNEYGIELFYSSGNMISENDIFDNSFGIGFGDYSDSNTVFGNTITSNYDGFWLRHCSDNEISANDIVANDVYSLAFYYSSNNSIYNNNLISTQQIYCEESANTWDDGYPSGGNYWSNYTGIDTNNDGIGDEPHTIDTNNTDRYPLAAPINVFDAGIWDGTAYNVDVVSNSTVSGVQFNPSEGALLRFNVTGDDGTSGFCRVTIPKDLLWAEDRQWNVFVGGQPVNYTIIPEGNHTYLYFTYNHSIKTVQIQGTHVIPEFPSFLILPLFMTATLFAIIVSRRKRFKHQISPRQ